MKRVYFLASILFVLLLFVVCKNIVVFINVNPYVNVKTMSYVAKTVKQVSNILDETKTASAIEGHNYKYLYMIERGSEFLNENPIPNDMDFEVGIDLGNYVYDGKNSDEIAADVLAKMDSFIYSLNMCFNNNGNYLEKSPVQMLDSITRLHDWYTEIIVNSIDKIVQDKPYLKPSKFLMNSYKDSYRMDFVRAINKDEIWLYEYPKMVFYVEGIKFNKSTRNYLREVTIHPTYYIHLTTGDKTKLVELTSFNIFGINLNPKNTIFSSMTFENLYSYEAIKRMCESYYLSDKNNNYINTRMHSLVNHAAEYWARKNDDEKYRPIKVLKRMMQAANIFRPVIGEDMYKEIQSVVVENLEKPEIKLLNEYLNVLSVVHSVNNSVMYKRMTRDGKVAALQKNAEELANLIYDDANVSPDTKKAIKDFHEKYLARYANIDEEEDPAEITDIYKKYESVINKEIIKQTIDESKLQKYLVNFKDIFHKAGYNQIYLYWIDPDTIGILKDENTKKIKDTKEFAKENGFADFTYKLINKNQIPLTTAGYGVWARCNTTPEQDKYFEEISNLLMKDKKNFKLRYHLRWGL